MEVRRNPNTGDWEIIGLDTDQLFDIDEALIAQANRLPDDRPSRRRKTMVDLHAEIMEASDS